MIRTRSSASHALGLPLAPLLALLLALATSGCPRSGVDLVIVAESDLTPYEEIDAIEVELVGVGLVERTEIDAGDVLAAGIEVYDRRHATLDGRHVRVTALRAGAVVMTRDLVFDHQLDREIVVLMPRSCGSVNCSASETCIAGSCASTSCIDGTEPGCPPLTCEPSCAAEASCATPECRAGACLAFGDDELCEVGEWCDPEEGCAPRRASVPDAGTLDAASDDGGGADAGPPDAALEDAALEDAALEDATIEDATIEDAALDDAPHPG